MARQELHSEATKIDQRAMPASAAERDAGDVILVDGGLVDAEYLAELAFMDEPVTIRLHPSSDVNAISTFEVRVNGKGGEILRNGRWFEATWLPVGEEITIKRKYLEVIARAKIDTIKTPKMAALAENPDNRPTRATSAVHTFSVIEDRSPRGAAWLTDQLRRNF